jgi:S-formylglutathione hydrolase
VVVTVSAGLSFYMNDIEGTQNWETFIMEEFLPFIQRDYNISSERRDIAVTGISMGGFGSGLLAFRHPEKFGIVAMMEPVLWPSLDWAGVQAHQVLFRPDRLAERFGDPVDSDFFQHINLASIVAADPERIKKSGVTIYLEVGDEDAFGFHEGAEFLHRILWDNGIKHQYRLVRGADHIGASVNDRSLDRFKFIGQYLKQQKVDPVVAGFRTARGQADRSRGFEPFPFWPNKPKRIENDR